jgi:anti-sigma B factor antagonist
MPEDNAFPIASLGDDVCMVAARGELDGATAWRLQEALGSARASGARRLIADFAAVTYFDADALTVLAACATHIQREGASLVVVTDDPWLLRLLEADSLHGVVRIERSLRAVVDGFATERAAAPEPA